MKEIEDYQEILKTLDKLVILSSFKDVKKDSNGDWECDYFEMNKLIDNIINLYHEYGIEVTSLDFNRDVFPSINYISKLWSDRVSLYMEVFFKHRDDLENQEFLDTLMVTNEKDSPSNRNPIFEEMRDGFNILNEKYKETFNPEFDKINEIGKKYNLQKVSFNNITEVRNNILKRINKLTKKEENSSLKKTKIKTPIEIESVDNDEVFDLVDDVCSKLFTNYYDMNDNLRNEMYLDLPIILEKIVKLRIFKFVRKNFITYSKGNEYNKVIEGISELKDYEDKLDDLVNKEGFICRKVTTLLYPNKKKIAELEELGKQISDVGNSVVNCRENVTRLKEEYMDGFYRCVDEDSKGILLIFSKQFNISLTGKSDKLFGVFDFEKLPPNECNINEEYFKYGLNVPNVESNEFIVLSNMCSKLLCSDEFIKSAKSHIKK